jgi:hypothetical protein
MSFSMVTLEDLGMGINLIGLIGQSNQIFEVKKMIVEVFAGIHLFGLLVATVTLFVILSAIMGFELITLWRTNARRL